EKVILRAEGEEDIIMMMEEARKLNLPHYMVKDRGLTEVPSGSITALGIGPDKDSKIDNITGNLPLL
ncbi:MAG: peptidyl-tRNA hydrolase, partial [Candidatus Aenigmatarchaeota archaeon]